MNFAFWPLLRLCPGWLSIIGGVLAVTASLSSPAKGDDSRKTDKPNLVLIVSDDAGYADFSMHGSRNFPTPRIDALAAGGVRFACGYVTCSVCSPSRAGMLTGRYQQRFGHEFNIPPRPSDDNGLPLSETTLADALQQQGYRTIALGKWHLGYADKFHPLSRGFNDFYGFLQGSRSYWPIKGNALNRLLKDREPVAEEFEYMTDELGEQAARYIDQYREQPFFIYLAFNAVHTPMHALEDDLDASSPPIARRRTLSAMTRAMDRAVGKVLDALDRNDLSRNTLVVFVNDNGGATSNRSSNSPLRAHKGTPFEGGHRVPFVMRWPARLEGGRVYESPVSTLDLFPTFLAAAGQARSEQPEQLEGTDLIPFLEGEQTGRPHETLYWKRGDNWAIRHLDWKLVYHSASADHPLLFDLSRDTAEQHDLSAMQPDVVEQLTAKHQTWSAELVEPRWGRPKPLPNR